MTRATHRHRNPDDAHIADVLRSRGYRMTAPRRAVINTIMRAHEPLSIGDMSARTKGVDQVTVYRIVEVLEKEGILMPIRVPDAPTRFERARDHHHHIVCTSCGALEHIPCTVVDTAAVRRGTSFTNIIGHELVFFGSCMSCA